MPSCTPAKNQIPKTALPDSEDYAALAPRAWDRTSDSNHVLPVLPPYPVLPTNHLAIPTPTSRYLERYNRSGSTYFSNPREFIA
jgi:hypothetical protein